MRRALVTVLLAALLGLPGCFAYRRGRAERLAAAPEAMPLDAWTPRDAEAVRRLLDETPAEIHEYELPPDGSADALDPRQRELLAAGPKTRVVAKAMYGDALVRELRIRTDAIDAYLGRLFRPLIAFEANGYVLTSYRLNRNRGRLAAERARRSRGPSARSVGVVPDLGAVLRSDERPRITVRQPGLVPDQTADRVLLTEGVPVRFPESLPESPRGVLIHLWALTWNEYEEEVILEFVRRGWVVVEIDPVSSARPDIDASSIDRILALEAERDALLSGFSATLPARALSMTEFKERLAASPDSARLEAVRKELKELEDPGVSLCSEADVAAAAEVVTRLLDDAGTENAHAVEASLDHLLARHPALEGLPVVIAGFSAGALSAPAAAARIRDRVDALVLVGGAANVAGVASRSTFSDGGLRYRCGGEAAPEALVARVAALYLERSRLDPYRVAPALRGLPVLHVHARYDEWVPSDLARLLNDRLGGPDRLVTMFGGHKALFFFLPNQARRIANWVERQVAR